MATKTDRQITRTIEMRDLWRATGFDDAPTRPFSFTKEFPNDKGYKALVRTWGEARAQLMWSPEWQYPTFDWRAFGSDPADGGGISHYSEFSGGGGTTRGASSVPGVYTIAAANHNGDAIATHEANFPEAEHFQEDLTKLPIEQMPWAHLATFSPACPAWTTANGVKRDFDKVNADQGEEALFEVLGLIDPERAAKDEKRREEYKRSRLLMKEVPRYLRAWVERGRPVPIAWVENVIQCRLWHEWDAWIREFRQIGYDVYVIAFNAMHARPVNCEEVPQSRDRLFVGLVHKSLNRKPDWDKWLLPEAWCPNCVETVTARKVFKKKGVDMGRYGVQYIYQCPKSSCRMQLHPETQSALSIIDPTVAGVRIGDREELGMDPLADATMDRIAEGVRKFWLPMLVPVGGTWRADKKGGKGTGAQPLNRPLPTTVTRETDGIAVPPLIVPVEGRSGKVAAPATLPIRTQTCRAETGVALPPFITPLRGGGDKGRARDINNPFTTFCASGNHHGLALPPDADAEGLTEWAQQLLVPYYGNSDSAYPATRPMGTLTTRDRFGVASTGDFDAWARELNSTDLTSALADVRFRMLTELEVQRGMGFHPSYKLVATSKRARVRLLGNAVPPAVAEVITSALVECLTGEDLPRERQMANV